MLSSISVTLAVFGYNKINNKKKDISKIIRMKGFLGRSTPPGARCAC